MAIPTPPFTLYRLPYVALKQVLCEAEPREIFILSTCSQRSYRVVKSIKRPSPKWKIFFDVNSTGIENKFDDGDFEFLFEVDVLNTTAAPVDQSTLQMINIGSFKVLMEDKDNNELATYWDDEVTGMKEMNHYFTEIFHRPIGLLGLENNPIWRVDWINTRQKSVEGLYYETRQPNVEDISYVFSNLKVDKRIIASFVFPDNLARPEIRIAPFSLKMLEISNASWMTLEHILAFDCEYSDFRRTNLSSQNLNALLKHWINGGFSRLEMLSVSTNEVFNYETVLEGVEFEEISPAVVRQYPIYRGVLRTRGGFDVTRESDGSTITVVKDEDRSFYLVLTSKMNVV